MILGSQLGTLGRTQAQYDAYKASLSSAQKNILTLRMALMYLADYTGNDNFNPTAEGVAQLDITADLDALLAAAVAELAREVLERIGVTGQIPGLSFIVNIATGRTAVRMAYNAGAKGTIDPVIQDLANAVGGYTDDALDFIDDVRRKVAGAAGRKISLSDLRAVYNFVVHGGAPPALPSLSERGAAATSPMVAMTPTSSQSAPLPLMPFRYSSDAFTVHDPSINKWRVFVRT